jgi:hypothetical protein
MDPLMPDEVHVSLKVLMRDVVDLTGLKWPVDRPEEDFGSVTIVGMSLQKFLKEFPETKKAQNSYRPYLGNACHIQTWTKNPNEIFGAIAIILPQLSSKEFRSCNSLG